MYKFGMQTRLCPSLYIILEDLTLSMSFSRFSETNRNSYFQNDRRPQFSRSYQIHLYHYNEPLADTLRQSQQRPHTYLSGTKIRPTPLTFKQHLKK